MDRVGIAILAHGGNPTYRAITGHIVTVTGCTWDTLLTDPVTCPYAEARRIVLDLPEETLRLIYPGGALSDVPDDLTPLCVIGSVQYARDQRGVIWHRQPGEPFQRFCTQAKLDIPALLRQRA